MRCCCNCCYHLYRMVASSKCWCLRRRLPIVLDARVQFRRTCSLYNITYVHTLQYRNLRRYMHRRRDNVDSTIPSACVGATHERTQRSYLGRRTRCGPVLFCSLPSGPGLDDFPVRGQSADFLSASMAASVFCLRGLCVCTCCIYERHRTPFSVLSPRNICTCKLPSGRPEG